MRKADIRRKPDLKKIGNKITIKQSPEELELANQTLELAKTQPKSKKIVRLPQGYSPNFIKKNII